MTTRIPGSAVDPIDGGEQTTDGYRRRGVWRQALKSVDHVRDRLGGSFAARVAWGHP